MVLTRQHILYCLENIDKKSAYGQFQRHGDYISEIFLDFSSSFHIFSKCTSKIIQSHYKAIIMDKVPYEVSAIFSEWIIRRIKVFWVHFVK